MFDEAKQEIVCNLRRNLFDAVNAEYISSIDVKNCCSELKKYLPDDFAANFYEVAIGNNVKRLTKHIRNIDVDKNIAEIGPIVRFLTKSLQTEYLLELNNLIERAYKTRNLTLFEHYSTKLSIEAEKVVNGVYEVKMPREVFIAYSSKDMDKVSELCEVLEEQGLNCFVAARNLRHGKGSVENYDRLLSEAMDHCRSFVFVSSTNSRSFNCDALIKELPYIQQKDIENAPAEYKNSYPTMPHQYKKPRVEYRIEESRGFNAADSISNDFFDGYERVYSPEAVAERVIKQLVAAKETISATKKAPAIKPVEIVQPTQAPTSNISALLKRAMLFIEDEDWHRADELCEQVLNQDPENAQAYVIKLMIDLEVTHQDDLEKCGELFDNNGNYRKALRFADEELAETLKGYIKAISDSLEETRKNRIYLAAMGMMSDDSVASYEAAITKLGEIPSWRDSKEKIETCKQRILEIREQEETNRKNNIYDTANRFLALSPSSFADLIKNTQTALKYFESIPNWHDSNQKAEECIQRIAKYKAKLEELRKEQERIKELARQKRRKVIKISAIVTSAICIVIALSILLNNVIIPNSKYQSAIDLMESGKYEDAIFVFDQLKDYKDSATKIQECKTALKDIAYEDAVALMESKKYSEAIIAFEALRGYKDSTSKISECKNEIDYETALDLMRNCMYEEAIAIFRKLGQYKSCEQHLQKCITSLNDIAYEGALTLMKEGRYAEAIVAFEALNGYKDSAEKISECQTAIKNISYEDALALMNEGKYAEAIVAFEALEGYKDSAEKIAECQTAIKDISYEDALALMNTGMYSEAIVAFEALEGYKNTQELIVECNHYLAFEYLLCNNDSEYAISGYNGDDTEIFIPSKYMGLPVTLISNDVFAESSQIKKVSIGNNITYIASKAFYKCTALREVVIPDSVNYIGYSAFEYCSALESIVIPDAVQYINSDTFGYCSKLSDVTIGQGVKYIDQGAFRACASLVTINIPNNVTHIFKDAFRASALVNVSIPKSVVSIGDYAFSYCSSLETISFYGTESEWSSINKGYRWNYNTPDSFNIVFTPQCDDVNHYYIEIDEAMAPTCTQTGLTEGSHCSKCNVVIIAQQTLEMLAHDEIKHNAKEPTCTEVGWNACVTCSKCDYSTYIENPPTHRLVNHDALEATCADVGWHAYVTCSRCDYSTYIEKPTNNNHDIIEHVAKDPTCTEIGWNAYVTCSRCDYSTYIEKPTNNNHDIIEHVAKDPTCTEIGWNAYVTCSRCDYSTYKANPKLEHRYNHENTCTLCADYLDKGVEFTPLDGQFMITNYSGDQSEIIIPSTYQGLPVVSIKSSAFEQCMSITKIVIPDSVTSIGQYAFSRCTSLTSVTIGNGVTSIGYHAFYDCSSLTYNEYDNALYLGNSQNPYLVLVKAKSKDTNSCTINKDTRLILNSAFYSCTSLEGIVIPDSVTSIGYEAFFNCTSLTSVTIPNSVTSIGRSAFLQCTSLTSVTIGNSVESIDYGAFCHCISLASITIPESVTSIETLSFYDCDITIINYIGTKAQWQAIDKEENWNTNIGCRGEDGYTVPYTVCCIDGELYERGRYVE